MDSENLIDFTRPENVRLTGTGALSVSVWVTSITSFRDDLPSFSETKSEQVIYPNSVNFMPAYEFVATSVSSANTNTLPITTDTLINFLGLYQSAGVHKITQYKKQGSSVKAKIPSGLTFLEFILRRIGGVEIIKV